MSDRVLPSLSVCWIVREGCHYPGVYLCQGHHLGAGGLDGHGDEGNVGVGRLLTVLGPHYHVAGHVVRELIILLQVQHLLNHDQIIMISYVSKSYVLPTSKSESCTDDISTLSSVRQLQKLWRNNFYILCLLEEEGGEPHVDNDCDEWHMRPQVPPRLHTCLHGEQG